jgi:hypothetical protein
LIASIASWNCMSLVVATAEWDARELARPKSAFSFTHAVKARGIDGWTAQQWGAQHLWLAQ